MFVDHAKILIKSGKGGNGAVSFRKEKYVPDGGPDGGDGGRGGDVIAVVDSGMRTLMDFRYRTKYDAENGENGGKKKCFGKSGENLIIKVPPGTIIREVESGRVIADLIEDGESRILAKGGKGGRGNTHFTNSVRQAPTFSEQGDRAIERSISLELKMIADVGLVGYPNVGKSTMLSVLTKAKPKIANYHFTTIKPNLGVVEPIKGKSFVMADIPGLIEGAAEGVGLGHDFLRHVERTRLLIHVVDVSGVEGRDPIVDFDTINKELALYSDRLAARKQIVVANKTDLVLEEEYEAFMSEMKARGYAVFSISAATQQGLKELMEYATQVLDEIPVEPLYTEEDLAEVVIVDESRHEVIVRLEDDVYVVEGYPIERLLYGTDFNNVESLRHFEGQLRKRGIFDRLKEIGIEDGDTVRVIDFEFEFYA